MATAPKNPNSGHRKRLRERFLRAGLEGLQDYEAIELVLTFAIPRHDVKPLAKQLLEHYGSLEKLLDATPAELLDQHGLGEAAVTLLALHKQLCTKYLEQKARDVDVLGDTTKIVNFLRMKLGGGKKETFMVLFLNAQNHLLCFDVIPGTVDRATVYAREVLEKAINTKATAVILAHNHPTGICEPSPADIKLTNTIRQVLQPVGILLHDHIIVAPSCYFSFASRRML
jgi:DNA repair protein radC